MTDKPTYEELEKRVLELERAEAARKKARPNPEESEDIYRKLIDFSPLPFLVTQDERVIFANPAALTLFGITDKDEIIGTSPQDWIHPSFVERSYRRRCRIIANGGSVDPMEMILLRHDKREAVVIANATRIYYHESPALLTIFHDITERKRAEEALRESHEKTKLFAYSVSHDLKSPSTAIYGLAKRLQDRCAGTLDEKSVTYCDQILGAAEHISTLVRQINDYISASQVALNIERLNLRDILRMVKEEFSEQLGIRRIKWSEPEHLPDLRADRIALRRVLRNLVDNALKYGGDGFSQLRIGYEDTGTFHVVSVSNNGAMIREEHIMTIFGPFQRYETARGVDGSGLGLTIVRDLAEKHGGKAWVESEQEEMTTFHISISKNL